MPWTSVIYRSIQYAPVEEQRVTSYLGTSCGAVPGHATLHDPRLALPLLVWRESPGLT